MDVSPRPLRGKGKDRERERGRHEQQRRINEEYDLWQQDEYDDEDAAELAELVELERRRNMERERDRNRDRGVFVIPQPAPPHVQEAKREAAVAAARQAASVSQPNPTPDYAFSRAPLKVRNGQMSLGRSPLGPVEMDNIEEKRRNLEFQRQYEEQQRAMKQREEEIMRKRNELRRKEDEERMLRRQNEAEEAARAARSDMQPTNGAANRASALSVQGSVASVASVQSSFSATPSSPSLHRSASTSASTVATTPFYQTPGSSLTTVMYTNSRNPVPMPTPPTLLGSSSTPAKTEAQPSTSTRPPSFIEGGPTMLPMENPVKYEGDSTDSESIYSSQPISRRYEKFRAVSNERADLLRTPTRKMRSPSPITTTSPPPPDSARTINYPRLMSTHQQRQGYYPSHNSMFAPFEIPVIQPPGAGGSGDQRQLHSHAAIPLSRGFYSSAPDVLHSQQPSTRAGTSSATTSNYPQRLSVQQPPSSSSSSMQIGSSPQLHATLSYPSLHQSVIPIPLPTPPVTSSSRNGRPAQSLLPPVRSQPQLPPHIPPPPKIMRGGVGGLPILKTVNMPRECLPRFLAIAKVNTTMNRETCGLLLGKDKGSKYVVTTLLIPKQHSTSDTCTMDGEELVLQFTEERSLITLGWIHTHPSQSCFMSSVDLHTHSGFQRMLPESFAVVCAPKSKPNFGIFRLTDPPGLKIILECKEKDAFHPHPDKPIYTDADKGHVQMKDGPLEIVDLR
ncbi:hypothetical protein AX17_007173 [Amanita inopinata Kibby_2008]|nr:hypothetical protein AX17_007173 [Amanita inopinata Kibby_2008]